MFEKEFCIIGGGVGGLGFLDGLLDRGVESVLLLEGKDELMYTLGWLKYVKKEFEGEHLTGYGFRNKLINKNRPVDMIMLSSKIMNVDPASNKVYFFSKDKLEVCSYKYLAIAAGGVPIIYGKYLLPGYRGAGIFSAYQVGEMLDLFNFKPGKKLVILGDNEYAVDLAYLARDCGIEVSVVSPVQLNIGDIEFYSGNIKLLRGDLRLREVILDDGKVISCDSLAVAGRFVPERWWRENGIVRWDLKKWEGISLYKNLLLVGDIKKPIFNFVEQYSTGYDLGRNLK